MQQRRKEHLSMQRQRGGTLLGFVAGLILGLAVALGVAIYITKVPVPFMKSSGHNAEQESQQDQKLKDQDPNAPLYGRKGSADNKEDSKTTPNDSKAEVKPEPKTDAKADAKSTKPDAAAKIDPKSSDPIAELARSKMATFKPEPAASAPTSASKDPFVYFVQAGAYRTTDEAEAQRAKLGLMGLDAKINERDQGGRSIYRVRVGPVQTREEADRVRAKLDEAHLDSVLVRMQR